MGCPLTYWSLCVSEEQALDKWSCFIVNPPPESVVRAWSLTSSICVRSNRPCLLFLSLIHFYLFIHVIHSVTCCIIYYFNAQSLTAVKHSKRSLVLIDWWVECALPNCLWCVGCWIQFRIIRQKTWRWNKSWKAPFCCLLSGERWWQLQVGGWRKIFGNHCSKTIGSTARMDAVIWYSS